MIIEINVGECLRTESLSHRCCIPMVYITDEEAMEGTKALEELPLIELKALAFVYRWEIR